MLQLSSVPCLNRELQLITPLIPAAIIVGSLLTQPQAVQGQGKTARCHATVAVGVDLLRALPRAVNPCLFKDLPLILQGPQKTGRPVQQRFARDVDSTRDVTTTLRTLHLYTYQLAQ